MFRVDRTPETLSIYYFDIKVFFPATTGFTKYPTQDFYGENARWLKPCL